MVDSLEFQDAESFEEEVPDSFDDEESNDFTFPGSDRPKQQRRLPFRRNTCVTLCLLAISSATFLLLAKNYNPKFHSGFRYYGSGKSPVAIFHFGPRKTASTSIQVALAESTDLLAEDRFVYYGHKKKEFKTNQLYLHACHLEPTNEPLKKLEECQSPSEAWEAFVEGVAADQKKGLSFAFSDEGIYHLSLEAPGNTILEGLARATAPYRGKRYVTLNYRDYPDWIISEFHERISGSSTNPSGTKNVDGFVDWYRKTKAEYPSRLVPTDEATLTQYQNTLGPVYIFNMHKFDQPGDSLIVAWFCQAVPWATRTCQKYRDEQAAAIAEGKSSMHLNPSEHHLPSIRLAQFHLHLRHEKKNEEEDLEYILKEAEIIESWLHNMTVAGEEVPLECLSETEQEELWTTAVSFREMMVPDFDVNNIGLKDKFDTRLERDFCQVDYDRLAELPAWKDLWAEIYGV